MTIVALTDCAIDATERGMQEMTREAVRDLKSICTVTIWQHLGTDNSGGLIVIAQIRAGDTLSTQVFSLLGSEMAWRPSP